MGIGTASNLVRIGFAIVIIICIAGVTLGIAIEVILRRIRDYGAIVGAGTVRRSIAWRTWITDSIIVAIYLCVRTTNRVHHIIRCRAGAQVSGVRHAIVVRIVQSDDLRLFNV